MFLPDSPLQRYIINKFKFKKQMIDNYFQHKGDTVDLNLRIRVMAILTKAMFLKIELRGHNITPRTTDHLLYL